MSKLLKELIVPDGQTDPNYRKLSLKKNWLFNVKIGRRKHISDEYNLNPAISSVHETRGNQY